MTDRNNLEFVPLVPAHWIPIKPDGRGLTKAFECSNCHQYTFLPVIDYDCSDYMFCPHCGAKMCE